MAGRYVEKHQLIRALGVVNPRLLHRVAGIAQVDKADALDHTAIFDIQARNDAFG